MGISPLTADYVNPEAPWPHLAKLAATCAEEGYILRPRLAIYPEFIERDGFLDSTLRQAVMAEQNRLTGAPTEGPRAEPSPMESGAHA